MLRFINDGVKMRARCSGRAAHRAARGPRVPRSEPAQEPLVGTEPRAALVRELTALCRDPPLLPLVAAGERCATGDCCVQLMPFEHNRAAAYFHQAWPETVSYALAAACEARADWESTTPGKRAALFERAATLLAGEHRARVVAAAVVGQGMTAAQAERNLCQLADYIRFGCYFLRELARDRRVANDSNRSFDCSLYHGLEGFWAAITPYSSFATAAQLAITPALMGNCVVWKPSDRSVLACYRVLECLLAAGVPSDVISFVPAEESLFLELVCMDRNLAGVTFAGTTGALERVCRSVGERVDKFAHFPRVVGTGSAKNFHVVHSSADLHTAVACTVRAAFESAGQKATSCSRVFVSRTLMGPFTQLLKAAVESIVVCHPLDYRCFMSALTSLDGFDKVCGYLERLQSDSSATLVTGGHAEGRVGHFVSPTVVRVRDAEHALLHDELRGPVLALCEFHDADRTELVEAIARSPYACTGSIFAQDREWGVWAVSALRELAPTLFVNECCSEERPGHLSLGGARKSGLGLKAGSMSYLLQFATERSLTETLATNSHVTYPYMNECPPRLVLKVKHKETLGY